MGMVAAGLSIVSGLMSIQGGKAAYKDAKRAAAEQERLGRENAAMIDAETQEAKRRAQKEADEQLSQNRARAAASGAGASGTGDDDIKNSQDLFMASEADRFQQEIDWLQRSGSSKASLALKEAQFAARNTIAQGKAAKYAGISSGIGSIGMGIGGFYENGLFDGFLSKFNAPKASGPMTFSANSNSIVDRIYPFSKG